MYQNVNAASITSRRGGLGGWLGDLAKMALLGSATFIEFGLGLTWLTRLAVRMVAQAGGARRPRAYGTPGYDRYLKMGSMR